MHQTVDLPFSAETSTLGLHGLEDYEPLIGARAVERIRNKAAKLPELHVVHVSSTFYGGGGAEILTSLTLLMNTLGVETGWRMFQGTPDFFTCTKLIHNSLQGSTIELTDGQRTICQKIASKMMIGIGMPSNHNSKPRPKPMVISFDCSSEQAS
jgi:trehalose synthase